MGCSGCNTSILSQSVPPPKGNNSGMVAILSLLGIGFLGYLLLKK